jgi:hypothetical protein
MGKHAGQGSSTPVPDPESTATDDGTEETLTASTTQQASKIGSRKKPDPYWTPHEDGKV